MFGNSAVWQLISISDWISKYFILLGLFVVSVVCVAIILYKFFELKRQRIRLAKLLVLVKRSKTFGELAAISTSRKSYVADKFLAGNLGKLKELLEEKPDDFKKLLIGDVDQLDLVLSQDIDALVVEQERYLPVLGTSASVSPLVGLFGTIWGLVNAFISISQEKSADIAVIAPGIAAALLTTLAGLVVAIPAMIMFNYFSNELRKIEGQLYSMQDLFLMMVKQTFVK